MSQIIPTRSSNPCAICENTTGKCRAVNNLHLCMTLTDNSISVPSFRFLGQTKNDLWGKWIEDTHQEWNASKREQRQRERRQFQEQRKHEESQRSATSPSGVIEAKLLYGAIRLKPLFGLGYRLIRLY